MTDIKYFLTFDFRILYSPNINLGLLCKELDVNSLEFVRFDGDINELKYYYEIQPEKIDVLVKNILTGEIGTELNSKEMYWLELFEDELTNNKDLISDNKLTFNYLILKLKLLGFDDREAEEIITNYYKHLLSGIDILTVEELVSIINRKMKKKKFWVCNDLSDEKEIELEFIKKVLNKKIELSHNFDFDVFRNEYLEICKKSFINKIYKFNSNYSYLISNPLSLVEQKQYLISIHKSHIAGILQYLIQEYKYLSNDTIFFNMLIEEMSNVLKLYLSIETNKI